MTGPSRMGPGTEGGYLRGSQRGPDELLAEQQSVLAARISNPLDNFKPASGEI